MIQIKQHNEKWRIAINEEWEFKDKPDMMECLFILLNFKESKGQINSKNKQN